MNIFASIRIFLDRVNESPARQKARLDFEYEKLVGFDPNTMTADITTLDARIAVARAENARRGFLLNL